MDALSITIEETMSKLQDFISNNTVHSYRFVIYAYSNGNTSEEQLSIDSVTHPRGKYEPFMLWSMAKISEWKIIRGMSRHYTPTPLEWSEYDQWLFDTYNKED